MSSADPPLSHQATGREVSTSMAYSDGRIPTELVHYQNCTREFTRIGKPLRDAKYISVGYRLPVDLLIMHEPERHYQIL